MRRLESSRDETSLPLNPPSTPTPVHALQSPRPPPSTRSKVHALPRPPPSVFRADPTDPSHRALDDIQASIRELKFYRDNIFIPLEPVQERTAGQGEGNSVAPAVPAFPAVPVVRKTDM